MLDARGTVGYIAPEVLNKNFGDVSHKSDVYSFGMMVLEIVGERKMADVGVDHTANEIYFPQWIYKRFELNQDLGLGRVMSNAEVEIVRKLFMYFVQVVLFNFVLY
ncbi:Pr5-like receptor kinase [Thalictrum thalictroides]|uniref:Pr5-like receptor kinase n=1 Tax=Thalictrum thalictroides TaxID=46969 RepID=A0A7J6W023_THATH|nr:Pr5-like receptor kinase [Thalictrum thalictroides]